jgi:3-hydroxybutyryl-CoA dehydrogenase
MRCERVAVIGSGTMGAGIAYAAALGGFATSVWDVAPGSLRKARETVEAALRKGVEKGKVAEAAARAALERLAPAEDLASAVREADLVIEAVPEDLELKRRTFAEVGRLAPERAVLATNTSSLSVSEIAAAAPRPERGVGMHFFNPVPLMRLVEVVRGRQTADDTVALAVEAARRMGKETVLVRESPGFVTTRMNALIGNEAFRMLEEGVASAPDIDRALKLGLNHPMGPFELVDLVGLDTRLSILRYLHATLGEHFRPSPLLEKLVAEGRLGKKAGRGVYDYREGREGT